MNAHFTDNLKSGAYAARDRTTKQEMRFEYLGMIKRPLREADSAADALKRSLRAGGSLSNAASDRVTRQ